MNPLILPAQAVGSTFTLQVKVHGMDQFSGWDIEITTNQGIINDTSLDITGNIFDANTTGGIPFEIVHCLNGKGTGCTSSDGPGIAHSAYANTAFASGTGLLFTVTFKVVGNGPFTPIIMTLNQIENGTPPPGVPHSTLPTFYGLVGGSGGGGRAIPK